jgi:adenine-specific DNA-methyltransferase
MSNIERLDLHTPDFVNENIEKIAAFFPNCVTETAEGKKIDFDLLQQELSYDIVEGNRERYRLEWPGKREAIVTANLPTTKTLRPVREDSVDFDNTENLYIEGDNLEVLKLLQESYFGKIKMIYIDPPYNTGNDFVYKDNFAIDRETELFESGQIDEYNRRLVANPETSGRYHSDWLSMMYPRLKLARNLLSDNGVIFISIDDHEVHNLRKICDEIFGEDNFLACVIWQRTYAPISMKKYFSENHDFLLIYAKYLPLFNLNLLPRTEKQNKDYKNPDNDPRGVWKGGNLTVGPAVEKQIYEIVGPTGKSFFPPKGYCWRFTKERFEELRKDNRIWFGPDGNNSPLPKLFLTEVQDGVTPMTVWTYEEVGHNQESTRELRNIFDEAVFTNPKPLRYMNRILYLGSDKDSIILDFFSGSATTAHAVMQLNAEDGGNRKFIMVQLPELTDENSEAYKAGYKNTCEIGKERIRRAGKKVASEQWSAISDETKKKYGCKELSRTDSLAKSHGAKQTSLFDCEKTSEGGTVCSVGSNEAGGSVDTVEHSRGTGEEFNEGVSAISVNSTGIESGTGNAAADVRKSGIPCRFGYFGSDGTLAGSEQNDSCPYKNTNRCPLITDIGFRVYRLDSSNMKDVYYRPQDYKQETLDMFADNIKPDRTADDLLAQVMLDWGLPLSYKIEQIDINGKQVFRVAQDSLLACFDTGIDEDFAKEIAKVKPLRVVFRDSGFADDTAKINVQQLLKQLTPETEMKVI